MSPNSQIKAVSRSCGLVLLYHSVTDEPLAAPKGTVHHVHPQAFRRHLEQLAPFFEFVSIDEFVAARSRAGLASVTFDDGYQNIIDHAYPVLREFQVPCCCFLNPITLSGQWNWRDKVRFVIENNLEQEFSRFFPFNNSRGRFYRHSKHPDNNSAETDKALDAFLQDRQSTLPDPYPYITKERLMALDGPNADTLFSYGNHGMNHYVMSSLNRSQQFQQIEQAARTLAALPVAVNTKIFSAPFGGDHDVNRQTIELAREQGYSSLLMSRQILQSDDTPDSGVQSIERFMPRASDIVTEIVDSLG